MYKGDATQHAIKHIGSKYKCVAQEVKEMPAEFVYVKRTDNLVDSFTKLIRKNEMSQFCKKKFPNKRETC
eukprot:snap_masked-scaffold_4-processed-gene-6.7-mRNA-1 protein AED:1.00 eAED:1.00 QI:0/-1/0/0/-1/1/1/0/69